VELGVLIDQNCTPNRNPGGSVKLTLNIEHVSAIGFGCPDDQDRTVIIDRDGWLSVVLRIDTGNGELSSGEFSIGLDQTAHN
jgi:hypothetical protein